MVVASLILTSCTSLDLTAVQRYGDAATGAQDSFDAIAADFEGTCLRRRDFKLTPRELSLPETDLAPGYGDPTPRPLPTLGKADEERCVGAAAVSADWKKHNDVVLAYIQKLGAIAGVDSTPTFEPVGDSLVNASILSPEQNQAFVNLAAALAHRIIVNDERRLIADTVLSAHKPFHESVEALKVVDASYADLLHSEYNDSVTNYHCLIASELVPTHTSPAATEGRTTLCPQHDIPADIPLDLRELVSQQRAMMGFTLAAINRHRAASIAYAVVLNSLDLTQQTLASHATQKARLKDYLSAVQSDVVPLYKAVAELKETVK